ncbi:hypothetical protein H0A36_30130 [Endozoicomonas sp. SM1973]|uniref:Antitermination protein n=1 Tax=Spartinivicinus marinus TaxID=2994442 RepID=A0A853IEK5_9GAMM|nr:hypothetical protein [Spartinivicinus marinus]MCX4025125.1 hypothetical protein [Spartinivicinus marinus]MCX4026969.1 hypothetical protein [Spartinivicinus marinus]NYZ70272.1 hypothetical protein [Spartinivicinus marinus]
MVNANVMALLAHGSINYEGVPGGTPQLTAEDVAGALGMGNLPREAYLLGLLKYAGDKTVLHELDRLVQEYVIRVGVREGWREPWPKEKKKSLFFFLQFSRQMINEVLNENICKTCNGTGIYQHKSVTRKCNCNNGKKELNKSGLAKNCCIAYKNWHNTWHSRYLECLKQLHKWDQEINYQLLRYLFSKSS